LAIAAVAFSLLFVLDGELVGLVLALLVDGIGLMLTFRKLFKDRSSEPRLPWGLSAVAAALAIVALESFTLENLLFPIYTVVFNGAIFFIAKSNVKGAETARVKIEKM
jgi:hypothetical protein